MTALLPYLGSETNQKMSPEETLYKEIHLDQGWQADANRKALNTSVHWFLCPSAPDYRPHSEPGLTIYVGIAGVGKDAAERPRGNKYNGVFGYPEDRQQGIDDVAAGISQTMLAAETAHDNGPWLAGGPPTLRSVDPSEQPYIGPGRPFGGCHSGGMYVLMVDGSVRWVGEDIGARQFEWMATISSDKE
jgi:prepilin-type processing-associated H-X9-DG protein